MQQFVVPQFIEVEDKIFGPVTTRQFLILLIAGGVIFLAYRFGDFALFVIALAILGGFALVLAFVKVNGQSFHYFLLNIGENLRKPSLRIWEKSYSKKELNYLRNIVVEKKEIDNVKREVRKSYIRDLSLLVNTGGYYNPEQRKK